MSSGAYVALSGLRARAEQLDRLASDLANAATSGYKSERSTTSAAEREQDRFNGLLQSAIDVAGGPRAVDFRPGAIQSTGRELDFAIEGRGFFSIETPEGVRYTRNGHFTRRADGMLTTAEGHPVLGDKGPLQLPAGGGAVTVSGDGQIMVGGAAIGKPKIVDFAEYGGLAREENATFRNGAAAAETPATGVTLMSGTLEGSNVSVVERMAQLAEVSRAFEALQRGVTIMMNDLDGRAITELGRR